MALIAAELLKSRDGQATAYVSAFPFEAAVVCVRRPNGWEPVYGLRAPSLARFDLPSCFALNDEMLLVLTTLESMSSNETAACRCADDDCRQPSSGSDGLCDTCRAAGCTPS